MRSKLLFLQVNILAGLILSFFLFSNISFGQTAELLYDLKPYRLESGVFNGTGIQGSEPVNVFSAVVAVPDVPWMQMHFYKPSLGKGSYIILRSLHDDHLQKLDAVTIEQWKHYSAFFNGDAVELNLFVDPLDVGIQINVDEVVAGHWAPGDDPESICGPTDDRELSNFPASGRLLNVGCTGWIIPNGKIVSAGHCISNAGTVNTLQFNVPLSLPNGTLQHPGPEDQYAADVSTRVFVNGGVGNDWGVFEVFPNSVTGLLPKQAQNAYYSLMQDLGPDSIRITGYGVASGVRNQVQQTHVGPNAGSAGTTMRYRTDTTGGNSGSPVIDEATGFSVGVHTHGGCTSTGGSNAGTSLFSSAFWSAVDMGAGGCPVEPASDPNPANNSTNVSINLAELTWTNGMGAVTNELYFGTNPSSLPLVQSGTLATSWTVAGPLSYGTDYYWRVIEIGDTCDTPGPIWSFKTELDPNLVIDTLFCDDFESGTALWNITNDGGTCVWEIFSPPYPNAYTLPCGSACGGVFSADSDECGSGTTLLSTATIIQSLDLSGVPGFSYDAAWMEFDNDFRIINASDHSYVELSTDGGTTWQIVWSAVGVSVRNTHEVVDLNTYLGQSDVRIRLRSVQPGWDWWWTVDNFYVFAEYVVPVELTSFAASVVDGNINLSWTTATETNNYGFEVQRKSATEDYNVIGFVEGSGTVTESKFYSFVDNKVTSGTYTYRLKQIDFDGSFEYSYEVEVDVNVPMAYSLSQNYPNPFNPVTKINFSLASGSKVSLKIFDILGQEIVTLVSGNLDAGQHSFDFDASGFNSGVYFYTLEAKGSDGNNFIQTKKMILMK